MRQRTVAFCYSVFWIEDVKTSERYRRIIVQCGHNRLSHREARWWAGRVRGRRGCGVWFLILVLARSGLRHVLLRSSNRPVSVSGTTEQYRWWNCIWSEYDGLKEAVEECPDGTTKLDCRACCVEMHCITERNVTRLTTASFPGRIFNTAVFVLWLTS
jgi:hypothetical protein